MTMTLDQKARPRRHNGAIRRPSPSALDAIAIATKAFPGICPEGLTWGLSGPRAYEEHPWCGDEIDLCTAFLSTCTKIKTPSFSSYYLKHVVEDSLGKYIGNGEFIVACIASGFAVIPHGDGSPNAGIGISKRDVKRIMDATAAHRRS